MLFIETFFMKNKKLIFQWNVACWACELRFPHPSTCFSILKNTHWIFAPLLGNDIKTSRQNLVSNWRKSHSTGKRDLFSLTWKEIHLVSSDTSFLFASFTYNGSLRCIYLNIYRRKLLRIYCLCYIKQFGI